MKKVELYLLNIANLSVDDFNLSKDELVQIKNKNKAVETAASLYLKKRFVGDYFIDKNGKPLSNKVHFNISHSHDCITIALADVDIGVDIELIRPFKDGLIDFICSQEEKPIIKDEESFFKVWTAKESLLKCLGIGIAVQLKDVPALPFDDEKSFKNQSFFSKQIKVDNYQISLTIAWNSDFKLIFKEIKI